MTDLGFEAGVGAANFFELFQVRVFVLDGFRIPVAENLANLRFGQVIEGFQIIGQPDFENGFVGRVPQITFKIFRNEANIPEAVDAVTEELCALFKQIQFGYNILCSVHFP